MSVFLVGNYVINEASRTLSLQGREVNVQPLIFDFLIYLLHRQERAVSKDELMVALWPNATVTEASLQRVASLARQLLRRGNAEHALRSVSRFGYRFCVDAPGLSAARPNVAPPAQGNNSESVAAARTAIAGRKWDDAITLFVAADTGSRLEADDLEAYAMALECAGRLADCIEPLTRATLALCESGRELDAARAATSLSRVHLEKGEHTVASGWHKRAANLIGTNKESREYGLWCWMGARMAGARDDLDEALRLADEAYRVGNHLKDVVVESLGLIYRGFYRLCVGETELGLEDQNLAAAQGLSNDLNPVVGGILYCNILWACRNFGDWARAYEWTSSYVRWCKDSGMLNLSGSCRLHQAEVLGVRGTLREAKALIEEAIVQLANDAPWASGDAFRVLGDINFAIGDFELANSAYLNAYAVGWDPQPGLSRLQVETGDLESAYSGLERSLQTKSWASRQRRGIVLATLAQVAAQTGRIDRAREIITELESQPRRWPVPTIKALIAEARSELFLADGDSEAAVAELQSACSYWIAADSIVNAADARLRLASLLVEAGDLIGAKLEMKAAQTIAEKLESPRLRIKLAKLADGAALLA
jgi:DNA-binding winged helix-turn-helix (wHTH) protein